MNKIRLYTILSGSLVCALLFGMRTVTLVFAAAPTVTTNNVDQLTSTGVRLLGTANPNSISSTGYFRIWSSNPGSCSDAGGTRIPSAGGAALGAGSTNVNYSFTTGSQGVNLTPNTTYYYCAIATNGTIGYGTLKYFITQQGQLNNCDAPLNGTVTISSGSCNFPGSANVTGMDGTTLTINSGATLTLLADQQVAFQVVNKPGGYINKFTGATMRKGYVWVKDVDGDGFYDQSSAVISSSPTTPPDVGYFRRNTLSQEYISQAVDCNDADTNTYRQLSVYADTDSDGYGTGSGAQQCSGQGVPTGYATNNLDCNDSYSGATTDCSPQSVSNTSSSSITSSTATLNGSANTAGFAGTGYFKYSTSNVACASHASTSSTAALSALTTGQSFNRGISGLSPNTTYYWCAGADNSQSGSPKYAVSNLSFISAPGAPTSVSSNTVTQTTLNLTWTAPVGGAGGYKIYRCNRTQNGSCTPSFVTSDSDNASPHPDSGLTCNTQYAYQVSGTTGASGTGNEGSLSSPVYTVTTGACCTNGYRDDDGDGYGAGSYGCYSGVTVVATGGDCYDANPATTNSELARPGATTFRTTTRGTSAVGNDWAGNAWNSYDYNCDTGITIQYGSTMTNYPYSCTSSCTSAQNTPGWTGAVNPAPTSVNCGQSWRRSTACHKYSDAGCNIVSGDAPDCSGAGSCFSTDTTVTVACY